MPKIDLEADACRTHAEKCRAQASAAGGRNARDQFRDLAECWEGIARDIAELTALRERLRIEASARPGALP